LQNFKGLMTILGSSIMSLPSWRRAKDIIEAFLTKLLAQHRSIIPKLTQLLITVEDLAICLPAWERIIERSKIPKHTIAQPNYVPGFACPNYGARPKLPPPALAVDADLQSFHTTAFEDSISLYQSAWFDAQDDESELCFQLTAGMQAYFELAQDTYPEHTEGRSVMFLTLLELRITVDRTTCKVYPLLKNYNPEIPIEQYQFLVLPCKSIWLGYRSHKPTSLHARPL
jgi:hypothetical protein